MNVPIKCLVGECIVLFFLFLLFFAASITKLANGMPAFFAESPQTERVYKMLSVSQPAPSPESITKMYRSTSKVDKAQINSRLAKDSMILFINLVLTTICFKNNFSAP